MTEQEKIRDLQKKFLELRGLREEWKKENEQLSAELDKGRFFTEDAIAAVKVRLSQICMVQREIIQSYDALCIGRSWEKIEEAESILGEHLEILQRRQKYGAAIWLFLHLQSNVKMIEEKLALMQADLSSKTFEGLSEEQCRLEFEKYILFMETFQESIPEKRHQLAMKLMEEFDSSVVMGLVAGWIFSSQDENEYPNEKSEGQEKPESAVSFASAEEKTAEAENTEIVETEARIQETAIDEAEDVDESATRNTAEDEFSMTAEPSLPELHMTEADTQAVCEQSEDVAEAEEKSEDKSSGSANVEKSESTEKTAEIWEGLEESELAAMRIPEEKSKLEVSISNKSKFGFKEFKNDLIKLKLFFPRKVLQLSYDFSGITPDVVSLLCEKSTIECSSMCERLHQMGYFDKWWVVGYGEFYGLSVKGEKIFQNQKACELLRVKVCAEENDRTRIENTTNAALVRILYFDSLKKIISAGYQIRQKQILGEEFCVNVFEDVEKNKNLGIVSIVSDKPEEYARFLEVLCKHWKQMNIMLVLGLHEQHAKAVSEWLYQKASDMDINVPIWYCYYGKSEIFDFLTEEQVDLEVWEENTEAQEEEAEKEKTEKTEEQPIEEHYAEESEKTLPKSMTEPEPCKNEESVAEEIEAVTEPEFCKNEKPAEMPIDGMTEPEPCEAETAAEEETTTEMQKAEESEEVLAEKKVENKAAAEEETERRIKAEFDSEPETEGEKAAQEAQKEWEETAEAEMGSDKEAEAEEEKESMTEIVQEANVEPDLKTEPETDSQVRDMVLKVAAAEKVTVKTLSEKNRMNMPELTREQQKIYDETYQEMICSDRMYCATAYLKRLALQYQPYKNKYQQVAYAVDDPMENCDYNSNTILDIYFGHMAELPVQYAVAATLRNFFLNQYSYDYSMRNLYETISNNAVLSSDSTLSRIVYKLFLFKSEYGAGMDRYADYRTKEREIWARRLEEVRSEASSYYTSIVLGPQKENGSNKRFLETKKLMFARDSYIGEFLEAVVKDDRSSLKDMEDFLNEYYIKENARIDEKNMDQAKIISVIEDYWEEASKNMRLTKKSSDLMGSFRANLVNAVKKVIGVLCKYVTLQSLVASDETDAGNRGYRRERNVLLSDIREVIGRLEEKNRKVLEDGNFLEHENSLEEAAADRALLLTLKELAARLDGTYSELSNTYFYLGFLKNDKILLDEKGFPVLEDVPELAEFSVWNRIEQHAKEPEMDLKERFQDIFNGADDYGSAKWIARYLQEVGEEVPEEMTEQEIEEEAAGYPFESMKDRKTGFLEDLELAQSNGQFDETGIEQKESILQSMEAWYEWAKETQNYGFFGKILSAFKQKIREDAQTRAEQMKRTLQVNLEKHPQWMKEEKTRAVVAEIQERIQSQNYVAAEDLLNRLIAEDIDLDTEGGQTDYLEEFLSEYEFYKNKTAKTGFSLEKLMTGSRKNKDARGASRLLDYWPKGNPAGEDRVRNLLEALGFCTECVKAQDRVQSKVDMYQVSLKKPQNGKKNNYKHPIAAFGSEAEVKPFRVVCLYGRMDASRLIDTFKEIGNAKHTLVLLDFALTLRDRRELARKTKTELEGKVFAVIDRVVIAYLVNHYTETSINRILMSVIMPFASYQPYIEDSASVMPQEIFMGRKSELAKIEDPTGVNIVYGGRQLGKSALLRMAQKEIDKNENGDRAVVIDIKDLNYRQAAVRVSRELFDVGILQEEATDDWDELARNIKNRLRRENEFIPYLLLLMDEADAFIESCEEVNYQPLDALKDIQSIGTGRFKFVIAGLRNVVRFDQNKSLKNNRVLTHLGHLTIKPFRSMEARELLMVPLSYLGFRFPKDRDTEILISTILGTTNYFPGMIQLYCKKLIETMQRDYAGYSESETPPYVVRKEHIKKVLSERGLLETIREKFFITLKVDNDNYYHIIALLVAYHYQNNRDQNGCSAWDVIELADELGISQIADMDEKKVVALMEELRELNVFQYNGDERYRFTRLSFCQNMGTKSHIEDELLGYME